jgi:hypothetical protein
MNRERLEKQLADEMEGRMQPYRAWQAAVASTKGRVRGGVQAIGPDIRRRPGGWRATIEGPRGTRDLSPQAGRHRIARSSHRRRLRRRVQALGERHSPVSHRVARPRRASSVGTVGALPGGRVVHPAGEVGALSVETRRAGGLQHLSALGRARPSLGLYWAFTGDCEHPCRGHRCPQPWGGPHRREASDREASLLFSRGLNLTHGRRQPHKGVLRTAPG